MLFSSPSSGIGQDTINVAYPGDASHANGSGLFNLAITTGAAISVACSPNSIMVATQTSCTATAPGSGGPPPSGSFTFSTDKSGTFDQSSCNVDDSGSCNVNYTPDPGSEGPATISATYSGDQNNPPGSGSTQLTVTQIATSLQIQCDPGSVSANQTVSCDVSVQNSAQDVHLDPTGTITVTIGGVSSSCALNGATCSVTFTPRSSGTVSASYDGDADHSISTGSTAVSVVLRQSALDVNCNPNNAFVNQPISCAVTVNGGGPGPSSNPTGTVTISTDFGTQSCTLSAAGGSSSACSATLTPGPGAAISQHVITASYSGDSVYSTSNHSTNVNVSQRPASSSVSCSPNPVAHNSPTACTVVVTDTGPAGSPIAPTGSVTFQSNAQGTFSSSSCTLKASGTAGVASCSVTFTPSSPGNADINANYSGDSDHQASRAQTKLGVS